MSIGLENYVDFKVKTVQKLKNAYGFRIILYFDDGTQKVQQKAGFSTKKEAEVQRCIAIGKLEDRTYLVNGNMLAKEFFEYWIENVAFKQYRYDTYSNYKGIINNRIIPIIGNKRMSELNSADISRLYFRVFSYSESVALNAKAITRACMLSALDKKVIAYNPCDNAVFPKREKSVPYHQRLINSDKVLNQEQVAQLIEASKSTPIYILVLFMAVLGLRPSEVRGLRYDDVDFIGKTIRVERQLGRDKNKRKEDLPPKTYTTQEIPPKTSSSYRTIKLPDIIFNAIMEQRAVYERNRSRRSTVFRDDNYIFCSTYGKSRSKTFHYKYFKQLLKDLELPDIRLYDLRGTASTILLKNGVSSKAVGTMMGHAKEILCVDTYSTPKSLAKIEPTLLEEYIKEVIPKEAPILKVNLHKEIRICVDEYFEEVI